MILSLWKGRINGTNRYVTGNDSGYVGSCIYQKASILIDIDSLACVAVISENDPYFLSQSNGKGLPVFQHLVKTFSLSNMIFLLQFCQNGRQKIFAGYVDASLRKDVEVSRKASGNSLFFMPVLIPIPMII